MDKDNTTNQHYRVLNLTINTPQNIVIINKYSGNQVIGALRDTFIIIIQIHQLLLLCSTSIYSHEETKMAHGDESDPYLFWSLN